MKAFIHALTPESPARAVGLVPGDQVLAVNGRSDLEDLFDWRFEMADSEYLELTVRRTDGTEEIVEFEKGMDEDPGIVFESPVFTPIKTCNNACPFCFIDQQPEGLRPTLYVKDDDYRLSYFNNTYITLTNLTPRDRSRIEMLRPGPLYISVHCTVPEVREHLLMNRKQAGKIMDELFWLKGLEIPFHCQVVVCPGINDGEHLTRTLQDLAGLRPEALSVAVVPVGLTQYRGDLPDLIPVDAAVARDIIARVEAMAMPDFVFLSDEFYFKAGLSLPAYDTYGDFPQLDDGVGMGRALLGDFFKLDNTLPPSVETPMNHLVLTGKLASMILQPIVTRLNEIEGLYVDLVGVENCFWGQSVDIAGLVTGQDILNTLGGTDLAGYTSAIIPSIMLRHGTSEFLDGLGVADVSQKLGLPVQVVQDPYSAREFVDKVLRPDFAGPCIRGF